MTLVEITFASGLMVLILLGGISIFIFGTATWFRGQGQIDADQKSQKGVRIIADEIREALSLTVDANGKGLSYTKASLQGDGSYAQPLTSDGIARRIYIDNLGNVFMSEGASNRLICTNVVSNDPLSVNAPTAYTPFVPGIGTITRSVTLMLVTQTSDYRNETTWSRSRETVYLRNIPALNQ